MRVDDDGIPDVVDHSVAEDAGALADQTVARGRRKVRLGSVPDAAERTQLQHAEFGHLTRRTVHCEFDLDRSARPLHADLEQRLHDFGQREQTMFQHGRERHEPHACARNAVVHDVVFGRIRRADGRQRAVFLRRREIEPRGRKAADAIGPAQLERAKLTLGVQERVRDRRKLDDVPRISRAEPETGFTAHDGLTKAKRNRRDPVFGLHRWQRVEIVGPRDAGEARIEPRAARAADNALEHHRHFFFLEPIWSSQKIALRGRAERRRIDTLDGGQQLAQAHVHARVIVRQHEGVVNACERLILRIFEQARRPDRQRMVDDRQQRRQIARDLGRDLRSDEAILDLV